MTCRNRAILLSLIAIVVTGAAVSAQQRSTPHRSFTPDGAWFATATMSDGTSVPFMDIYSSNPTALGRKGSVICTLSVPPLPTPYGLLGMTQGAHGSWVRIGKNEFAFTAWRILIDADQANQVPDGAPMGTAKFRGTITVTGPDTFTGTMNVEYFGPDGQSLLTLSFTTAGSRIAVQLEP